MKTYCCCSSSGQLYEGVRTKPPANWGMIEELRAIRNCVSPDQLLRRVLDDCDYESGLTARGRANVEKFLSALRSRHQASPGSLSDALDYIRDASPEAEAPPADFGDAVRLMTIHKSKGLEFPVVFLPYPSPRSRHRHSDHRLHASAWARCEVARSGNPQGRAGRSAR